MNTITGEGLGAALAGAQVVVDVANSPSFEDAGVLKFFETSGTNLPKSPEYLALNTTGAVPLLVDGEIHLTQNAAILSVASSKLAHRSCE